MMCIPTQQVSPVESRSPFDCLDANHDGVRLSSSSPIPEDQPRPHSPPPSSSSIRRDEQHRRKLLVLHHAAFCNHVGPGPCPAGHSHCLAHKRIFTHMQACLEGSRCFVPGCAKARVLWTHFSTCTAADCAICSVIPAADRHLVSPPARAHLPRSPKALVGVATTPARRQPVGRPPLSPGPRLLSPPGSPTFNIRS